MNQYLLITLFLSLFSPLVAMENNEYEFRLATRNDLASLVHLVNEEACQEEGIVIPPKKFRNAYFQSAIDNQELFVISDGQQVVGYKKLFVMDDEFKKKAILEEELRCSGAHAKSTYRGSITYDDVTHDLQFVESSDAGSRPGACTYLYNGVDFTRKTLRGRGLNQALMRAAFDSVIAKTKEYVLEHSNDGVAMVYGITESNGAFDPGASCDRTCPITRLFVPFAQEIAEHVHPDESKSNKMLHERYVAFKPSFDPDEHEFKPLPDECSVEGRGVVLSYLLHHKEGS